MHQVPYPEIAARILSLPRPPTPPTQEKIAPTAPLNFEEKPEVNHLLPGGFLEGTFVHYLAATGVEEKGEYNVVLDPYSPNKFYFPTNTFHPQSAPLRPSYLIHVYRLLLAIEDELKSQGRSEKVVAIYDCGEDSGADHAQKCVRFYITASISDPSLPHAKSPFPSSLTYESPSKEIFGVFNSLLEEFIPKEPSYNLVISREEAVVIPRARGEGVRLEGREGRVDGALLCGIEV